ncbi:leucine-rich repeats and immunoglobulin-like domains protein 1 [Bombina bombina]|uniref:leucine-rich repeats and immunoglobulin-like domains protein 1 n=1 Tax=Bombina bombina TaxID=8345 RepID=UPI00235AA31C|nr:leucine-rich repeats and immunoglobulin-like domains protein 1 [Bombina bombina]
MRIYNMPPVWCLLPVLALVHMLPGLCNCSEPPCPLPCTCTDNLVDCSNLGLTDLPDLPAWTTHLNLSFNKLTEINPDVFQELHNLREVQVGYNALTAIPSMGSSSSNIISLSMHHNKIRTIEQSQLKSYVALEALDLSSNEITEIRKGSFPQDLQIKELHLGNNKIIHLDPGSFDNLSRTLLTLRLSKNRISYLPVKAFKLPRLTQLELKQNRIFKIEGLTFLGLESLEVLKLQRNKISKLTDGAFWGLSKMQILHLENNSLTEVKSGALYGLLSLQQLHLGNNSISKISAEGWSFCQKLQELVLSYNRITRLDEGSLADLGTLDTLRLSHNAINYIAGGAFKGVKSLRILELDHNEISGTIEDTNGAFIGLDALSKLSLFGNKIKSVASKAFSGLGTLEHLNLGENAIRSVHHEAFLELRSLKELHLNSDNLLCDCHLKWFPEWLSSRNLQSEVKATCIYPESLKGQNMFSVLAESFVCDDFPKPQIIAQPNNTMAVVGSDISFTCSAASSSNTPMVIAWKKDSELLHNAEVENFSNVIENEGEVTEYTTILHLRSVTFTHEGRYQCIITNHFGSTYSDKAELTVNVLPSFMKTPQDITVRVGYLAKLECAAEGHPVPEIAWQKDGGTDFPAARERRMHVMPDDDLFFIMNVKIEDMGIYSCTAQNSAGSVSANATVTILEMPHLVHPLDDRIVSEGATLALQCKANGNPPPRITWLKGDKSLVTTDRHHFTPGNQLLIIKNVVQEDAGKYTCVMSNTLGTERASSHVSISQTAGCGPEQARAEGTMTFGIITIAVVCSIVLTSLVWVCIIYQTRKKAEEYSVTNTDETVVPPDLPSYLSSQGISSSDGTGATNVEACTMGYRKPRICLGCSGNEAGKPADTLFSAENGGYGFPVMCTNCYNGPVYHEDTDYSPQILKSEDYTYQRPPHDQHGDNSENCSSSTCHQSHGPLGSDKKDSVDFAYPSNHERKSPLDTQTSHALNSNTQDSNLEPLLNPSESEGHQTLSASDCLTQQILNPLKEEKIKQTMLSNGQLSAAINLSASRIK